MKEFKSKVGYGILIPLLTLLIGIVVLPVLNGAPTKVIVIMSVIILPTISFILHIFFRTTYLINERNELIIKCGFIFNSVVDITKIKSVRRTRNPISSPAPSMDRIDLKYGEWDSVIISPKDKQGFMSELLKINPNIDNKIN